MVGAVSERLLGSMRRASGRRTVDEEATALPCTWGHRARPTGGSERIGNRGGGERRSAILDSAASRGARMVEDAADDAAFGCEGDDPHHALTAGTDERVDFVHASWKPGPATPKSGRRWGRAGRRRRRMIVRPRGERLCLLVLAPGLQLPAHDVRIDTVVMDQVPSWVGNVREETGDEVEGVEGLRPFRRRRGGRGPRRARHRGVLHGAPWRTGPGRGIRSWPWSLPVRLSLGIPAGGTRFPRKAKRASWSAPCRCPGPSPPHRGCGGRSGAS